MYAAHKDMGLTGERRGLSCPGAAWGNACWRAALGARGRVHRPSAVWSERPAEADKPPPPPPPHTHTRTHKTPRERPTAAAEEHFTAVVECFVATMQQMRVPPSITNEAVAVLAQSKRKVGLAGLWELPRPAQGGGGCWRQWHTWHSDIGSCQGQATSAALSHDHAVCALHPAHRCWAWRTTLASQWSSPPASWRRSAAATRWTASLRSSTVSQQLPRSWMGGGISGIEMLKVGGTGKLAVWRRSGCPPRAAAQGRTHARRPLTRPPLGSPWLSLLCRQAAG